MLTEKDGDPVIIAKDGDLLAEIDETNGTVAVVDLQFITDEG